MKNLKWIIPIIILIVFTCKPSDGKEIALETGFQNPPTHAKPHIWWQWISGCVSKQGITNDLEAMAKQGIGGATIKPTNYNPERFSDYAPAYDFMTPEWRSMVSHAIQEAERLGLNIQIHIIEGSATSGGPWVKPHEAMKTVTFARTTVKGPAAFKDPLPEPPVKLGFYKDIAVLAYPVLPDAGGSMHDRTFTLSSNNKRADLNRIADLNMNSFPGFNLRPGDQPVTVTISFDRPFAAASIILVMVNLPVHQVGLTRKCLLEYSNDGKTFMPAGEFYSAGESGTRSDFPEVRAKHFRFTIHPGDMAFDIPEFELLEKDGIPYMPKINDFEKKAGYWIRRRDQRPTVAVPENWAINRDDMIDLSDNFDEKGVLTWEIPEGEWQIMRIGYTLNGEKNRNASEAGRGLECDKLDARFVEAFFNGMPKEVIEENRDLAGKSFTHMLGESWESQCQNWTDLLPEEFKARRGYNITPYLPVLCGQVVGSTEISERFLYDFRKTIAELIKDNYYGKLARLCESYGMKFMAEASGAQQLFFDPINYPSVIQQPMTEFWINSNERFPPILLNGDVMGAVAASQLYDNNIVSAEAFTAPGNFKQTPFNLKRSGDMSFALGINQWFFLSGPHQPDETYPGWMDGKWGIHINRKITWWEQSNAWFSYLARSQFLLQQGRFVGDILAFTGEGAPVSTYYAYQPDSIRLGYNRPPTRSIAPTGYAWTGCNDETILDRLTVKDGKLFLPNGMSYRVLTLPSYKTEMSTELLQALKRLVGEGAVIYGPKPLKAPGLEDYPACDEQVRTLAAEIWGEIDGINTFEHTLGKGRVFWGIPLKQVLEELGIEPDFEYVPTDPRTDLAYLHRKTDKTDLYFISNQTDRNETLEYFFRVGNKQPELWYSENGSIKRAGQYEVIDGRVKMPLMLDPYGSVFVVFRENAGESITKVTLPEGSSEGNYRLWKNNDMYQFTASLNGNYVLQNSKGKTKEIQVNNLPSPLFISGSWQVRFPEGWGAPEETIFHELISWHNHNEEGIKYFSGTASYLKEIDIPAEMMAENYRLTIDLGEVRDLARVVVNGKDAGILWKLPFSADITKFLVPGKNDIEIEVTNVWANRLIGDEVNPQEKRFTEPMTTVHYDEPHEQILLPSGLLGPVKISVSFLKDLRL